MNHTTQLTGSPEAYRSVWVFTVILGLFRRKHRKTGEPRETSNEYRGKMQANNTSGQEGAPHNNTAKHVSKTITLAELAKILANPSQLLELVRRSPILYTGFVQSNEELKSLVKKYGNTPLLLSIRSNTGSIYVIHFDGKFYTLVDGSIKAMDKLVSNGARVIVYRLE